MTEQELIKYLNKFTKDAIEKFRKGRKEHNDDLMKLNCRKERYDEDIDSIIYSFIEQWQEKKKKHKDDVWWRIWERFSKKDYD